MTKGLIWQKVEYDLSPNMAKGRIWQKVEYEKWLNMTKGRIWQKVEYKKVEYDKKPNMKKVENLTEIWTSTSLLYKQ